MSKKKPKSAKNKSLKKNQHKTENAKIESENCDNLKENDKIAEFENETEEEYEKRITEIANSEVLALPEFEDNPRNSKKYLQRQNNRLQHLLECERRRNVVRQIKASKNPITAVPSTPEEFIRKAELALSRMLDQDNTAAVLFTLKSLGASKGWTEGGDKSQIDVPKLQELKEFFTSVGDKQSADSITVIDPVPCKPSLQNLEPISKPQVDPDLWQGYIGQPTTNFP